jgi:hypothetical protein
MAAGGAVTLDDEINSLGQRRCAVGPRAFPLNMTVEPSGAPSSQLSSASVRRPSNSRKRSSWAPLQSECDQEATRPTPGPTRVRSEPRACARLRRSAGRVQSRCPIAVTLQALSGPCRATDQPIIAASRRLTQRSLRAPSAPEARSSGDRAPSQDECPDASGAATELSGRSVTRSDRCSRNLAEQSALLRVVLGSSPCMRQQPCSCRAGYVPEKILPLLCSGSVSRDRAGVTVLRPQRPATGDRRMILSESFRGSTY